MVIIGREAAARRDRRRSAADRGRSARRRGDADRLSLSFQARCALGCARCASSSSPASRSASAAASSAPSPAPRSMSSPCRSRSSSAGRRRRHHQPVRSRREARPRAAQGRGSSAPSDERKRLQAASKREPPAKPCPPRSAGRPPRSSRRADALFPRHRISTASAARLLSLALVPEDGGEEFYVTIAHDGPLDPWVERHVVPYLDMVPEGAAGRRACRAAPPPKRSPPGWRTTPRPRSSPTGPRTSPNSRCCWSPARARWCRSRRSPCASCRSHGFSTAANSAVPHNALHDARALRDHVMNHLE